MVRVNPLAGGWVRGKLDCGACGGEVAWEGRGSKWEQEVVFGQVCRTRLVWLGADGRGRGGRCGMGEGRRGVDGRV